MLSELIVFLMAMLPVTELRVSIPYAIAVHDMPIWKAFLISTLGNSAVIFLLLPTIPLAVSFIFKHSPVLKEHLLKYFLKLHTRHSKRFDETGAVFLALFVAVPLPGTGVWTGSLLAYLFNIQHKFAIPALAAGVFIASVLVAFFSGSLIGLWRWLS